MGKKTIFILSSIIIVIVTFTACTKLLPSMINPANGLCGPVALSNAQTIFFSQGNDQFFANRTAATGLGPYFVATGCGSCHSSDNRGHPFTILTRFGQSDSTGNKFLAQGGPQLGSFCLPGYTPEEIPDGNQPHQSDRTDHSRGGFPGSRSGFGDTGPGCVQCNNPDGVAGHPNYNSIPAYVNPLNGAIPRSDGKYICRFGQKGRRL